MAASMKMSIYFTKSGIMKEFNTYCRKFALRRLYCKGNATAPVDEPFPHNLDVDPEVVHDCERREDTYMKEHPGKMVPKKAPALPEHLEQNARQLLAERNLIDNGSFQEEVRHLYQVYLRRQAPLSTRVKQQKLDTIVESNENKYMQMAAEQNPEGLSDKQYNRVKSNIIGKSLEVFSTSTHKWNEISYDEHYGLVYLAARLAPNYRVLYQIFNEIKQRDPKFIPGSFYNFGSGVGTAVWAANSIWGPKVYEYYCVDPSKHINDLSMKLMAKEIDNPIFSTIKGVYFRQFPKASTNKKNQFHMVVSAYTLMEQPGHGERLKLLKDLWNHSGQYLVLVEHGTMAGYKLIMEARSYVLKLIEKQGDSDGHVFAPCPHDYKCPNLQFEKVPCNFPLKYKHLSLLANAEVNVISGTEKYSYVVIKRGPRTEDSKQYPRILDVTNHRRLSQCKVCCNNGELGLYNITQSKPSKALFRCVKRSIPGDFLPVVKKETAMDVKKRQAAIQDIKYDDDMGDGNVKNVGINEKEKSDYTDK